MKSRIIAIVAAAVLGAPLAAPATAGETHANSARGYDYHDRHDRGRHDHDHHKHYAVSYHLHGTRRVTLDHHAAHRTASALRGLGVDAHVDNHHSVHYHMHGSQRRSFESHASAHRFARWLEGLGFDVSVRH